MSKYDPLLRHLSSSSGTVELAFREIEEILGFALPASARRHAAWWSNSGGTHVQSAAWQGAGYRTEDVNLSSETIQFVPEHHGLGESKQPAIGLDKSTPREIHTRVGRHPAFGIWKGLVTLDPGYDYTQPAYPEWGKVYDE